MHVVRMMEAGQASAPRTASSAAANRRKDRLHHAQYHHNKGSSSSMRSASSPSSSSGAYPITMPRRKGSTRNVAMMEQERLEEEDRIAMSVMNNLYRHARSYRWTGVQRDLQLCPEQTKYIHLDGTTTLHLAVMSRTGYILDPTSNSGSRRSLHHLDYQKPHEQRYAPCPLDVLEWICRLHPAAALQPCHVNSYTPLAYACLVATGGGGGDSWSQDEEDEEDGSSSSGSSSSDDDDDDDTKKTNRRRRRRHHSNKQQERNPSYSLEDAQEIVRILLKYCPECTKVFTAGGLSALDVHIVSYSQQRNQKSAGRRRRQHRRRSNSSRRHHISSGHSCASTDERSLASSPATKQEDSHLTGRTNTLVLRTLLEADPTLAHVRISKDRVTGPVELLYRCNSADFLKVVSQEEMKQGGGTPTTTTTTASTITSTTSTTMSPSSSKTNKQGNLTSSSSSKQIFMKNMSQWWVWRWTILILKYGTVPTKKRGAKFSCLQAAAGLVGCPLPILTLAMNAFPSQVYELDQMHGQGLDGNLPLHEVCSWPCEEDVASTDPVIPSRKGMAIAALLGEYPEAAKLHNTKDQTPLELAVESGTTWDSGVRKLVRAHPKAVSKRSETFANFYPFLCAAVAAGESSKRQGPLPSTKRSLMTHLKNVAKQDLQFVRTIYGLLRANPLVLISLVETSKKEDNNNNNKSSTDLWSTFPQDSELWASVQLQEDSTATTSQWTDFGSSSFPSSPSTTNTTQRS